MSVVEVKHLYKTYQLGKMELPVLKDFNMSVQQGEYISIMGPSGSGKSTLLNILGCLDRPTSGEYLLNDREVTTLEDDSLSRIRGAEIGFVFQSYNLIAQLNVIENIEVPMVYQGYTEKASKERAIELAEKVGLGDRIKHKPFELSGGQQQRVAIARALANDPLFILADEPTGNLDSKSGREILDLLNGLHDAGKTMIMITHDKATAECTQKTIHLLDGKIERIDENRGVA